jgi:ketosteroid isomerase-like protein
MKALMKTVLVVTTCLVFDPVLAQPPKPAAEAPSVADTIKQLVRDWCDAMITDDIDKLNRIIADDWTDGYPGKMATKSSFLSYVKSGKHKLEACEFGPMDVKVLGNVAVLQASLTERRLKDGQVDTVRIACMDVFEKRGDRWVVVRSQAHKL